jgi:hypothetical protein
MAHGYYSSTANCLTKTPEICRGIFGIFRGMSSFLLIFPTTSRKRPNGVLQTPVAKQWSKAGLLSLLCVLGNFGKTGSPYRENEI